MAQQQNITVKVDRQQIEALLVQLGRLVEAMNRVGDQFEEMKEIAAKLEEVPDGSS